MSTSDRTAAAREALRAKRARRSSVRAEYGAFCALGMPYEREATPPLRTVARSVALEAGRAATSALPPSATRAAVRDAVRDAVRGAVGAMDAPVADSAAARRARFDAAGAELAAGMSAADCAAFMRDGVLVVRGGPAARAAAAFLQGPLLRATRTKGAFVAMPHNAREQTDFEAVDALGGLTVHVLGPVVRRLVDAAAQAGRPRDHFVAHAARFLVSPLGTSQQAMHADKGWALSAHFAVTAVTREHATLVELGSHARAAVDAARVVRAPLDAGDAMLAFSCLRHAGSAVAERAQSRVFAYVQLLTAGAPLYEASKLDASGGGARPPTFKTEREVLDEPIGGGARMVRGACHCCMEKT